MLQLKLKINKGWRELFFHYSEEIQKIFPNIKSSKDLERQFNTIVRLIEWGKKKVEENNINGNIKILGFGHENYVASILNKYLGDHRIANCESISIHTSKTGYNIKKVN